MKRSWKKWWWFAKYWLRCLAKDIERAKYDWEDEVEGGPPWRMIWGPRMLITYHRAPGESVASHMSSQRVMPLEDIYNFVVGNFKKVFGRPRKKRSDPFTLDLRRIIADSGMKEVMDEADKELLRKIQAAC